MSALEEIPRPLLLTFENGWRLFGDQFIIRPIHQVVQLRDLVTAPQVQVFLGPKKLRVLRVPADDAIVGEW